MKLKSQIDIVGFIIIIIFGILLFSFFYFINDRDNKINKCLEPIAKEVCSKNGFEYNYINKNYVPWKIVCHVNSREQNDKIFLFYDSEWERCSK